MLKITLWTLYKRVLEALTSSVYPMIPLTGTTPICSDCKDGCVRIRSPALYLPTCCSNFVAGDDCVSPLSGGLAPLKGASFTSICFVYKHITGN